MTGPACGNNPNYCMSDGDRQAVDSFRAYLTARGALRDRIAKALADEDARACGWGHGFLDRYGADAETDGFVDAVLAVLPAPVDQAAVPSAVVRKTLRRWAYAAGHIESELDGAVDRMYELVARDLQRRVADETAATATQAGCPGYETVPNRCPCPCEGCKHHCSAHQPATETHPPAAAGLPAGTLEAAEIGANRLDAWARSPQGRNFLAHALVQLARTGWLRPAPGEPFEPKREDAPPAEPAVTMHAIPLPGSNGVSACCGRPPCEFVGERVTRDSDKVTCTGPAAGARQAEAVVTEVERCAHCNHPQGDHDGRADHRAKHSPLVAGEPWCHACNAQCDYAAGAQR